LSVHEEVSDVEMEEVLKPASSRQQSAKKSVAKASAKKEEVVKTPKQSVKKEPV